LLRLHKGGRYRSASDIDEHLRVRALALLKHLLA
jgi:hypothetical protein